MLRRDFFPKNSFLLHVCLIRMYVCLCFKGPSRNKPFCSEFGDSYRKSVKVDYVTDNIIGHWPVFTVLLSSRLCPIYLAALTLLNIIGLCRVSSPGRRIMATEEITSLASTFPATGTAQCHNIVLLNRY